MAKVTGAKRIREALDKLIPQIKSPENMRKIGDAAAAMIKLRTRLGSGVSTNGADKEKLKPLAPSTIKARAAGSQLKKRIHSEGHTEIPALPGHEIKLHPDTSAGKSNLTRTGALLDSEKVLSAEYGKVSVGPSGGRNDSKLTNERVAEYVTRGGRPFNNLSKVEVKRLQDGIKKQLRDLLKRVLTK